VGEALPKSGREENYVKDNLGERKMKNNLRLKLKQKL
jgi:hypothetical protein